MVNEHSGEHGEQGVQKQRRYVYVNTRWGYDATTTVISVKIPITFLELIDKLIQIGLFQNRSDAIREAIRLLILRYHEVVYGGRPRQTPG